MPFYNSEDYIERAVLSVINQTYDNWELIAINDGSQDDSLKIISKYANNDKRIRIISKENGGYSTAINYGLDNLSSNSDYFLFLGSDDELIPQILSNLNKEMEEEKFDLVGFKTICVQPNGEKQFDEDSNISKNVKEENTSIIDFYKKYDDLPQLFIGRDTSRIYKTSLLGDLRYFGKFGVAADGIFSMLFAYKCKSFAHLALDGYLWHLRSDSVSSVKPNNLKKEDAFNNWFEFFSIVMKKGHNLTNESKKYINHFIYSYIKFVSIDDDETVKRNKNRILLSKRLIKRLIYKFDTPISFKKKMKIRFPFVYRKYLKIKNNQ